MSHRKIDIRTAAAAAVTERSRKINENFVEGAIKQIRLKNFVTYDSLVIKPGPHLNVIIGPNGSGKSSIVCAICLGLGGKPSILGRASSAAEFIKYGCESSFIEITLFNPDGDDIVIRRDIFRDSSQWQVNGRKSNTKAVEEMVNRLNIQVSNLCQFLPQDKVADFAKMTSQELLVNTEKAVGGEEMSSLHESLQSARIEIRTLEEETKNASQCLEREEAQTVRLKQEVENYTERQNHLENIKLLKMKRPLKEYIEKRDAYFKEKQKKDDLNQRVKEARDRLSPLEKDLIKFKDKIKEYDVQHSARTKEFRDKTAEILQRKRDIENQSEKKAELEEELSAKKKDEEGRKKKLAELQQQLNVLKEELNSFQEQDNTQPKINEVISEMRRVNESMAAINQEGQTVFQEVSSIKNEIKDLNGQLQKLLNVMNQRLEVLRRISKDTHAAVIWLRANKEKFKGTIYEPLILTANLKDEKYAKYLEGHISFDDMLLFICEYKEDHELFMHSLKDLQRLRIHAATMPSEHSTSFKPRSSIAELQRFGFSSYMREVFDCPEGTMRYMCKHHAVHKVPLGNQQTANNIKEVISHISKTDIGVFFTEQDRYQLTRSKYEDKEVSSSSRFLRPPKLLSRGFDVDQERELKQNIQNKDRQLQEKEVKYKDLQLQQAAADKKLNSLKEEKKRLTEQRDKRKNLENKIHMKQQGIARVESEAIDIEQEEVQHRQKVLAVCNKMFQLQSSMQDSVRDMISLEIKKAKLAISIRVEQLKMKTCETEYEDKKQIAQQAQALLQQQAEVLNQLKQETRELLQSARHALGGEDVDNLSDELKTKFMDLPETLAAIDERIHREQAILDLSPDVNNQVMQEYQQHIGDIQKMRETMEAKKKRLERLQTQLNENKKKWLEPLHKLIDNINTNFSNYFRAMGCVGEVALGAPENEDDFEKYGVLIKVKFRDSEPLRELSASYQSGGEKSVSTMLYMMALQALTRCPFRCVDEINQGMDPENERRVFDIMSNTVCVENTSQYFLLTPKLLPDLNYTENMRVLCVFNGPELMPGDQWNISKFLRRASQLEH